MTDSHGAASLKLSRSVNHGGKKQRQVWVTKVAAVTALGPSLDELWERVLSGESAIRQITRFPVVNYRSSAAAHIEDLEQSKNRSMIHSLIELLISQMGPVPSDSLLITATTKAGIDNLERLRRGGAADPGDILLSSVTGAVKKRCDLRDSGVNISAACASSAIAVARGSALIRSGRADAVFVCGLDLVTEFVFSGFSCLGALSSAPCMPFDRDRSGLSLGEGAGALLLMSRERAMDEGRPCLGTVLGWGVTNDAHHITAPARDGSGLIAAIRKSLSMAMLREADISAICAHGTGTVYNDLMELTAFHSLFDKRKVPVFSIKGAIGHSMGAAGIIEVVLGLKALSEKTVPPTVGLLNPTEGAEGLVSPDPVELKGDCLLTPNSGFGGVNAAIILKRGEVS